MSTKQFTVILPEEVAKLVDNIANKKKKSVHATMIEMIETYTDAWLSNKALFKNRSIQSSLDRNSFILLLFLKAMTDSDKQFNTMLDSALEAYQFYGNLDNFILARRGG